MDDSTTERAKDGCNGEEDNGTVGGAGEVGAARDREDEAGRRSVSLLLSSSTAAAAAAAAAAPAAPAPAPAAASSRSMTVDASRGKGKEMPYFPLSLSPS